jgi:hypothetical protein
VLRLIENLTVTAKAVRMGDAVPIGRDHHQVVDLRTLPRLRKMLVFADSSAYILPADALVTVTRTTAAPLRRTRRP